MELKHLKTLTAPLKEDQYELPHPHLDRAEIKRLEGKFDQILKHLDGLHSIMKELEDEELDLDEPAHKLHHIGQKGQLDMSWFADAKKKLNAADEALQDLHMHWMMDIQQKTDPSMQDESPDNSEDTEPDLDSGAKN